MHCKQCLAVLGATGGGFGSGLGTDSILERSARALVGRLDLKARHFLLSRRDWGVLEHVSSYERSEGFVPERRELSTRDRLVASSRP